MAGYGRDWYLKGTIYSGGGYDTVDRLVLPLFHELIHAHGSLSIGVALLHIDVGKSNHANHQCHKMSTSRIGLLGRKLRNKLCREEESHYRKSVRDGSTYPQSRLHCRTAKFEPQFVRTPFSDYGTRPYSSETGLSRTSPFKGTS